MTAKNLLKVLVPTHKDFVELLTIYKVNVQMTCGALGTTQTHHYSKELLNLQRLITNCSLTTLRQCKKSMTRQVQAVPWQNALFLTPCQTDLDDFLAIYGF